MTTDVTLSSAVTDAQQTSQQSFQLAEDFDDFLILLTTQLQNQDPLNPMDSTEFTNQIVQFSQVEQQINQNQKLDSLVQLELASISSVALGYVGLDASYIGPELPFDGTNPVTINYSLGSEALIANINITNEEGELILTTDGPKSAGAHEFVWDGKDKNGQLVPAGTYTVNIDAIDTNEDAIATTTVVSGRVRGIETQNGVVFLLIGERAVPLSQVLNATIPPESADESAEEVPDDQEV